MTDDKMNKWASISLPEDCTNVCISFKKEIAEIQIKKWGAKPLYGFKESDNDWSPVEFFITYGGELAPSQRLPEA